MTWYFKKAALLQRQVIRDEEELSNQYEDDEIKRAILHARQDLILVVSLLDSSVSYLRSIRNILCFLLFVCLLYFVK